MASNKVIRGALTKVAGMLGYGNASEARKIIDRATAQRSPKAGKVATEYGTFFTPSSTRWHMEDLLHGGISPDEIPAAEVMPSMVRAATKYKFGPLVKNSPQYAFAHSHPGGMPDPSLPDLNTLFNFVDEGAHVAAPIFSIPDAQGGARGWSMTRIPKNPSYGIDELRDYLGRWNDKAWRDFASGLESPIKLENAMIRSKDKIDPIQQGMFSFPLQHLANQGHLDYGFGFEDRPDIEDLMQRVYEQLDRAKAFDYARGGYVHAAA